MNDSWKDDHYVMVAVVVLLIVDMVNTFAFPRGAALRRAAETMAPRLGRLKARLKARGVEVVVHEPLLHVPAFFNSEVIGDLAEFKRRSEVIVSNRLNADLADVAEKVYSRDLFGVDR